MTSSVSIEQKKHLEQYTDFAVEVWSMGYPIVQLWQYTYNQMSKLILQDWWEYTP
jgi:hypothetical protein